MLTNLINNITIGINSTILTIIIPILFISLLFVQSKFYKKDEWNEDYLSKTQTKIIKGFCAVGIVLHHLAQKTAAPWLESKYIIHGLDFFVNIGYLFVGAFLFISCPNCKHVYNDMISEAMPKVPGKCDDCGSLLVKRSDDNSETFGKRYDVYYENTAPLIDYYEKKGIFYKIDSGLGKDSVFKMIQDILGDFND